MARTKRAVREFDNINYRKMKKILIETSSQAGDVEGMEGFSLKSHKFLKHNFNI